MSALESELRSGNMNPQEFWSRFVQPRIAHIQHVSPLASSNLVADARRTLDNEMEALRLAICYLGTRRNALSLVSSLPDEVLARIFKFTAAAMPPERHSSSRLGWIPLTYVCRRWRDVALNHASLWASITNELSPRWQTEMLSRAKLTPLSISFPLCRLDVPAFIIQHISHTRELRVGLRKNLRKFCDSLTSSPAAALMSLEITSLAFDTPVRLPTNIFGGHTPSLRHLTLMHALFPWSAPIFRNLVELTIYNNKPSAGTIPAGVALDSEFDHFFRALGNMPTLERLVLSSCLPSRSQTSETLKTVVLPRLKELILHCNVKQCTDLVTYLAIPSSCQFALKCRGEVQPIDGLLRFLHAYTREQEPLRTLSIHLPPHDQTGFVFIKLWRAFWHATIPGEHTDDKPLINISLPVPNDSLDALEQLLATLPLEHLRSIAVLVDHVEWWSQWWLRMFGRCESVEHVFVKGEFVPEFFDALIPLTDEDNQMLLRLDRFFSGRFFFRRLKTLHVADVDFRKFVDDGDYYGVVLSFIMRMEKLDLEHTGLLGSDSGVDSRLEQLVITDCTVPLKCLEEFDMIARTLDWDGKGACIEKYEEDNEVQVDEDEEVQDEEDEEVQDEEDGVDGVDEEQEIVW